MIFEEKFKSYNFKIFKYILKLVKNIYVSVAFFIVASSRYLCTNLKNCSRTVAVIKKSNFDPIF